MAYPEIQKMTQLIVGNAEKFVLSVKSVNLVSVQLELARLIAMVNQETQPTIRSTADSAALLVLRGYLAEAEVASQNAETLAQA